MRRLALLLSFCLLNVAGLPARAQTQHPLTLTREADRAVAQKQAALAVSRFQQALTRYTHHPLRPYWVYRLAQLQAPSGLPAGDPLLPHYHWWRAMAQPTTVCSDGFSQYARLHNLSDIVPSVPESTAIQARLGCVEKRPEQERLAVARVLEQHRYFWLLPRLLKTVTTPEGLWLQGQSRMLARDYRAALASFQTLLKQQGASGDLKKQAIIEAGLAERRLGNAAGAEKWWKNISAQDGRYYPEVLWQRASLAYGSNQNAQGTQLLQELVRRFPAHGRSPDALEAMLRTAVETQSWALLESLGQQIVTAWPEHAIAATARYWLGRSLERRGQTEMGRRWLREQAETGALNNYYTHLARCRLEGRDCFAMRRVPLKAQEPRLAFLQQIPILEELAASRDSRILEVVAPFAGLSSLERELLKSWSLRYNGHYFRSIRTIWQQPSRDPEVLRLMYPLHYDALQKENAARFGLPQALIAGLTWQESMYMADIKSPAGATGLMQLMPATAREIAPKAGLPGLNLNQLTDPKVNIRLGSYYLHEQLQRWNGNLMPTIAAYNAGPGAASRWLASFGQLDKDMFVERIPYDETRRYVKQVLTHLSVYELMYGPQ
ncbi:MAG: transglycosylase SLT domain-containing protein [Candidatus Sericytochromatia bacterium]